MTHRLHSAHLKFARAVEHLKALKNESGLFMSTKPYAIARKPKIEGEWYVVRFWLRKRPPERLGLIAGDVVGNVSAALDHLVYGLSRSKVDGTGFPVYLDPDDYVRVGKKGRPSNRDRLLAGVPDWPDRAIIDAYQPYEGRMKADPLFLMRYFVNGDKHRVTRPGFARPRNLRLKYPVEYPIEVIPAKVIGELKHQAEICRFRFDPPRDSPPEGSVPVETEIDLSIGFGDMAIDLVDIEHMVLRAADIIAAF